METLSSLKNSRVMAWRSLKDRKGRLETGSFLVEGIKMVQEALASDYPVETLLLQEGFTPAAPLPEHIPAFLLPPHVFSAVCDTKTPQGIAAVVRLQPRPAAGPRLIALDQVQDPGNVGTILRTADAAGFDGALLAPGCADVFSPRVLRATMGSVFHLGLSFPAELPEALKDLRSRGYAVLSSQLDGEPFFERPPIPAPFVLILGNEGNGVSPAVQATATHRFRLPMPGRAESLNVGVAAGIMMYDLIR